MSPRTPPRATAPSSRPEKKIRRSAVHALAADMPRLRATLDSAFQDDPVTVWMFDDPATRSERIDSWMQFVLEFGITKGHLYAAGNGRATALWSPPDVTLFDEVWGPRMVEVMRDLIGPRAAMVMTALGQALAAHQIAEPHFYLFMLGTHAEHQGKGLGADVIEPVLALCDRQGLPAYLESSNIRNVPFYQRHGFEILAEVPLGEDGPVLRPMLRSPRDAA